LKIIGVVLAGGQSSRMKVDKSTLEWQGKTLLEYTLQLLSGAGCVEVLISNNNDPQYIQDRYPDSGPLAGIEACLNHIGENFPDSDAMLIMPVDMPLMKVSLLEQLIKHAKSGTVMHYNLGRFPLILPVNEKLTELLSDALKQHRSGSGVSIHRLLSHFNKQILTIDKDQESAFINCNTPEEWQKSTGIFNQ